MIKQPIAAQPTRFEGEVNEGSTIIYETVLVDELGQPLTVGVVEALTCSLVHRQSRNTINGRDGQSVLNENGGTFEGQGHFHMVFGPDDMVILSARKARETHVAVFRVVWDGGKVKTWDVELVVRNLQTIGGGA